MSKFIPLSLPILAAACLVFGKAHADDQGLRSGLTACRATNSTEQNRIGGVLNCGKVWKIKEGSVSLSASGDLRVNVNGLVLDDTSTGASNGTPDGVTGVVAALVCGPNGGSVVAQTAGVPINIRGEARVRVHITMPAQCVAPIVLVREIFGGEVGGWLAATGF
jgi:hypothetical protein